MNKQERLHQAWRWLGKATRWFMPRFAVLSVATIGVRGVYDHALMFMPFIWAVASAGSLELTYIGLALHPTPKEHYQAARRVSLTAVIASILMIFTSGFLHISKTQPALAIWWQVILSSLHAIPMPILGYMMSNLVLHPDGGFTNDRNQGWLSQLWQRFTRTAPQANAKSYPQPVPMQPPSTLSKTTTKPQKARAMSGGRHQEITTDDVLEALQHTSSRKGLITILGCSGATVDRRVRELIANGLVVSNGRGGYSRTQ